jgi:uncharacterized membrane protein YhaH (DUF805 family)
MLRAARHSQGGRALAGLFLCGGLAAAAIRPRPALLFRANHAISLSFALSSRQAPVSGQQHWSSFFGPPPLWIKPNTNINSRTFFFTNLRSCQCHSPSTPCATFSTAKDGPAEGNKFITLYLWALYGFLDFFLHVGVVTAGYTVGEPYELDNFDVIFTLVYFELPALWLWAATVRRLHDAGRDGWLALLLIVPDINFILFLVFCIVPGNPCPNKGADTPWLPQPKLPPPCQPGYGAPLRCPTALRRSPPAASPQPGAAGAFSQGASPPAGGAEPDKYK